MAHKDGNKAPEPVETKQLDCGLVMPISAIDGCPVEHWTQVQNFLREAVAEIDEPVFHAKLVSEEADVGVILKRIVQNVYNADIVICDVSGKNANVMFELGMRLAFDKPVVIIKDDRTDYSFDTGVIEHLLYPRDLRYPVMVEFKERLKEKVRATYLATKADGYQGFLKNFGTFKVAHIQEKTVGLDEAILDAVQNLQRDVARLQASSASFSDALLTPAQMAVKYGVLGQKEMQVWSGSSKRSTAHDDEIAQKMYLNSLHRAEMDGDKPNGPS
jgi:nucleoside 2-deoxyribosyltransferase